MIKVSIDKIAYAVCCSFFPGKWVLRMPFAGQNHLFQHLYTFSLLKRKRRKSTKIKKKYTKVSTSIKLKLLNVGWHSNAAWHLGKIFHGYAKWLIHELIHHFWLSIRLNNLTARHKTSWIKIKFVTSLFPLLTVLKKSRELKGTLFIYWSKLKKIITFIYLIWKNKHWNLLFSFHGSLGALGVSDRGLVRSSITFSFSAFL